MHFGGKNKISTTTQKSASPDAVPPFSPTIELNQIECSVGGESKTIFSKKFIESPMKDEKIFYHNKRITLYKTEMCRSFNEMGFCKYGDRCQFCHSQEELREVQRHPKYKTEICKTFWHDGSCPYGSRCCFVHLENLELVNRAIGGQDWEVDQEDRSPSKKEPKCGQDIKRSIHRCKKAGLWREVRLSGSGYGNRHFTEGSSRRSVLYFDAVRKTRKADRRCSSDAETSTKQEYGPNNDSTDLENSFDAIVTSTTEESSSSTTKACSNSAAGDLLANKADANALLSDGTTQNIVTIRMTAVPGNEVGSEGDKADSTARVSCIKESSNTSKPITHQACRSGSGSATSDEEGCSLKPSETSQVGCLLPSKLSYLPIEYNKIEDPSKCSIPRSNASLKHTMQDRNPESAIKAYAPKDTRHKNADAMDFPQESSFIGYLYNSTIETLIEARSFESDTFFACNGILPSTRLMMLEEVHFRGYQSVWEKNYIARWKSDPIFFILQDIKDIRY